MAKISDSIHAIAQTQEERILLAQIARKAETTAEKGYLTCTRFLDMHEHAMAARLLRELGTHSLPVYLLHQPVLAGISLVIKWIVSS